ncbi:hypothetical protein LTR84_009089 [Exophiala bonariae]|uniref:Xylanolytic transcriptional activator regulatory domain-containing protein n=1 Tax=Exophiala bonariae TaxID=1690606 RepID=A0AAV9MVQ3_9EURO|nr:hypothetical protein LTR84_009089 [Exophiala bonariae]
MDFSNNQHPTTSEEACARPSSIPRKRKATTAIYARKRAVAACQPCWDRDTSNLAILNRINHVVTLLDHQSLQLKSCLSHQGAHTKSKDPQPQFQGPASDNSSGFQCHSTAARGKDLPADVEDVLNSLDLPEFPAARINCESILRWPIFSNIVPQTHSFVLEFCDDESSDNTSAAYSKNAGQARRGAYSNIIQEENFITLSQKFLTYVHVKNPILDVAKFKLLVREASENGPGWDGPSCLVLIACALGCLAGPFCPESTLYETPESSRSVELSLTNLGSAQAFCLAAKKRLGLLQPSLLYVQCLFLFGVFEMYMLKPQQAWFYFQHASLQLQTHFWKKSQNRAAEEPITSHLERRLEQRLYWSCMKTECELRCEVPLPPSGITRLNFPDQFPSPPTEMASPSALPANLENSDQAIQPEEEKSWFYYLAEISFRRMFNRMVATMNSNWKSGWTEDIHTTMEQCAQFEEEIDIWCAHIPPKITWDVSRASTDELSYYIHGRAMSCREIIHRPFLYNVIHHMGSDNSHWLQATALAKKCLQLCVENAFHLSSHSRHHGTWYVARTSVTRALLLLAAARSGKIELPERWKDAVEVCMMTVQKWYDEAPDLKQAASVVQIIINETFDESSMASGCTSN